MSRQETELTAYCGLYCGDCIRYRSWASDLARDLLIELQHEGFDKYAKLKSSSEKQFDSVKQFEHYKECCEVLKAIVTLQCNKPYRVGGGCPSFSCDILECCRRKGFEGCWECSEFEDCGEFEFLKPFHGDTPVQNLRKIKEHGLDKWSKHRHEFYIWQ